MPAVQSNAYLSDVAAVVLAGLLDPAAVVKPTVKLIKAPFAPSPSLDPSTLSEADFSGYAPKVITAWGTPHLDGAGQQIFYSAGPLDWTPTGTGVANTIFGYVLLATNGDLVQAELLQTPIALNGTGTTLGLVLGVAVKAGVLSAVVIP